MLGCPRFAWFRTLKNSARNVRFEFSFTLNRLNTAKSIFTILGPMMVPRPTLPRKPGTGLRNPRGFGNAKADVSNQGSTGADSDPLVPVREVRFELLPRNRS